VSGAFPGLKPVYRGREEIREWWNQLREPWEHFWVWSDRILEEGDQVIAIVRSRGTARGAALPSRGPSDTSSRSAMGSP
jgi:ketosteroid isomerase-like protein